MNKRAFPSGARSQRLDAARAIANGDIKQLKPAVRGLDVDKLRCRVDDRVPVAAQPTKRLTRMAHTEPFDDHVHHRYL